MERGRVEKSLSVVISRPKKECGHKETHGAAPRSPRRRVNIAWVSRATLLHYKS